MVMKTVKLGLVVTMMLCDGDGVVMMVMGVGKMGVKALTEKKMLQMFRMMLT